METYTMNIGTIDGLIADTVEGTLHELPGYGTLAHVRREEGYWIVSDFATGLKLARWRHSGLSRDGAVEATAAELYRRGISENEFLRRRNEFPVINRIEEPRGRR